MSQSTTPVHRRRAFWVPVAMILLVTLVVIDCLGRRRWVVFRSVEEFSSETPSVLMGLYDFKIKVNIGTRSRDFPASLYAGGDVDCSANYVGDGVILTAAHCFEEHRANKDPKTGHLTWDIRVRLSKEVFADGICERPTEFKEGEAHAKESVKWDWALCKVDDNPPNARFEVISTKPATLQPKMDVLLTGFGIDLVNKIKQPGRGMRVGRASITKVNPETIVTCGSSVDDGDSGAGTYIYFDKEAKHRVQVAVNSRKNDGECDPSNPEHKSSTMLGLWRAESYIKSWRARYPSSLCGVHDDAKNCRGPSLSTVTPALTPQ